MFRTILTLILAIGFASTTTSAQADERKHHPHAATLWWVIFNNPDACTANPGAVEQCGTVDVFGSAFLESVAAGSPNPGLIQMNADAQIGVLYATGATTDARNGRIRLTASIYRTGGEPLQLMGDQVIDPMQTGNGFWNTDAEIHLVVRDHGRVKREGLTAQITNFLEPYCSDPLLMFEGGRNRCQDIQAAVYAPGETGQDAVYRLDNGQFISNASALLFRQGDAVQAVVETRIRDRRRPRSHH